MSKEQPLYLRLYQDQCFSEVARTIGYKGLQYLYLDERMQPLYERFGKERVQSAVYHLATFEGDNRTNVSPLVKVELRPHVRKLCYQLLGLPPEHPEHKRFHPEARPAIDEPAK